MAYHQSHFWPSEPPSAPRPWGVGELTRYLQDLLAGDALLQDVWLRGEISNWSRASSGHVYFTLKDAEASLGCVMWRSAAARLGWAPKQGDAAVAQGRISIYAARGQYQLYVDQLRPAGQGDLHARFEALRARLKAEGLFDIERKRALPPFPRVIGLVTSPQAAALRDVLNVLHRRYPLVRVLLAPAMVQGEQAPGQIVAALGALAAREEVDLILVVRGGGSLEELWAFNDEDVARAIATCHRPVISGVGHETDFTIADFVADVRAPTPSAAAELAVPDQAELRQRLEAGRGQLQASLGRRLEKARQALAQQRQALDRLSPQGRVDAGRQAVDELTRRAARAAAHRLALQRASLAGLEARLGALSPLSTLERGYAIVRHGQTGRVVRSVRDVAGGESLDVQVQDGEFGAVVRSEE
ncbi:MAG: exodeoxyribonuclease VII large subunit [Anaerolineae bacterium]|jgi:exodeoxyribonuclease VII large subunit